MIKHKHVFFFTLLVVYFQVFLFPSVPSKTSSTADSDMTKAIQIWWPHCLSAYGNLVNLRDHLGHLRPTRPQGNGWYWFGGMGGENWLHETWRCCCYICCYIWLVCVSSINSVLFSLEEKSSTVWCHYNMVNFQQNPHEIHPTACPLGRGMGFNFWFDSLI